MQRHRVTLDDVAQTAGVSRATASRALTGAGSVSAATRRKVRSAAESLNFSPHQAARALAGGHAMSIALVIPELGSLILADPFLSLIITGVSEVFHATKYQVILVIVRPDDAPTKVARVLRSDRIDGAIFVSQHGSEQMAAVISATDVPVVYIGRPCDASSQLYVDMDNRLAGKLVTHYLLTTGATRIACVAGPADMTPVQDRTNGWLDALGEAGLAAGPLAHAAFTLHGGEDCMREILEKDRQIDAVFAQSDLMAVGALRTLKNEGYSLPGQVKIIGIDNAEIGYSTVPRLSSVTNPAGELARRASQMLLRVLDGGVDPQRVAPEVIRPELVLRESA